MGALHRDRGRAKPNDRLKIEIDDRNSTRRGFLLVRVLCVRRPDLRVSHRQSKIEPGGLVQSGRFVSLLASGPGGWHGFLRSWMGGLTLVSKPLWGWLNARASAVLWSVDAAGTRLLEIVSCTLDAVEF